MAKPSLIYLSTSNSVSENHKTSKIWLLESFLYSLLLIFYYTAVANNAVFWRKIVPKSWQKAGRMSMKDFMKYLGQGYNLLTI